MRSQSLSRTAEAFGFLAHNLNLQVVEYGVFGYNGKMDKLKFTLLAIVILALLGLLGYWAVRSLQSGSEYVKDEKIKQLELENENLRMQIVQLTEELNSPKPIAEEPAPEASGTAAKPAPAASGEYQDLIGKLQQLYDNNVYFKEGSRGPNVGVVQEFLNVYNKTSSRIDNDYGPGTAKLVTAFQKDSGLSADGEAGKNTFNKMIEWLKKQ